MNFRQFLEHNPLKIYGSLTSNPNGPSNTAGVHNDGNRSGGNGSFVSSDWSGSEYGTEKPFTMPSIDLIKMPDLNSIKFRNINCLKDDSPIQSVKGAEPVAGSPPKNPIEITLENGRKIFMTFDEFKRAGGTDKIKKSNKLIWTLQPKGNLYQVKSIKTTQ